MLNVRFMNSFKAVSLDQFDDTPKTRLHVQGQDLELVSDAIIEQLYDPSIRLHYRILAILLNGVEPLNTTAGSAA